MFTAALEDQVVADTDASGDPASFSLQCQVTGNPTPTIAWFRQGNVIEGETDSTLTVNSIITGMDTTIDGVEYYCEANNSFGRIRSRRVSVQLASACFVLVKFDVVEICSYTVSCDTLSVFTLQLLVCGMCQEQGPLTLA